MRLPYVPGDAYDLPTSARYTRSATRHHAATPRTRRADRRRDRHTARTLLTALPTR